MYNGVVPDVGTKFLDWGMRTALVVDFHAATEPLLFSPYLVSSEGTE